MPSRQEVYAAIRGELEYAENIWKVRSNLAGEQYTNDADKPTEDWLIFIKGYFNDAVAAAAHQADPWPTLHAIRKLASLCVRCMLSNGVVNRNSKVVVKGQSLVDLGYVLGAIDRERDYQDSLSSDRTDGRQHKVTGYLAMFSTYLDRAINGWTEQAGDEKALDNVRKLAGIAVHCLEDCGAPTRELV